MKQSKPKFTPGPWTVETQYKLLTNVTTGRETRVPYYEVGSDLRVLVKLNSGLNDHSNAALIAAAPELYKAVQDLLFIVGNQRTTGGQAIVENAWELLAKARGEHA